MASIGLPHDPVTLTEKSLGGSETAAIHVARALAKRGHRVTMFAPLPERQGPQGVTKGGVFDGVAYLPIDAFVQHAMAFPHDVTIVSRDLSVIRPSFNSGIKVLWCHDLALKRARGAIGPALWNTDALYVLSAFQKQQYQHVYGLPDTCLFVTRNGVDVDAFTRLRERCLPRDPRKLVYGSRPERGLEACLKVMQVFAERGSDLRLEVSWYDDAGLAPQLQGFYAALREQASRMPNVALKGALTQAQWHEQLATARAMLYPGPSGFAAEFREISMIAIREARAAGTPSVVVGKGACAESLRECGTVVGEESTDCQSPEHLAVFAQAVTDLTTNDLAWQTAHARCNELTDDLSWDGVAAQWEAHWLGLFAERTADSRRMAAHFRRIGDKDALRELGL